mgnify:CR=1 FL=1
MELYARWYALSVLKYGDVPALIVVLAAGGWFMSTQAKARKAKREMALAVALADLARLRDARASAAALSRFAGAAVSATLDHLLRALLLDAAPDAAWPAVPPEVQGFAQRLRQRG